MSYNLNGNQYIEELKQYTGTIEDIASCSRTSNAFMDQSSGYNNIIIRPEISKSSRYTYIRFW